MLRAALMRFIAAVIRCLWRVDVRGLENLPGPDERYILVANHQSFLDVPVLLSVLRGPTFLFPIAEHIAAKLWVRVILKLAGAHTFKMHPGNPLAMRSLLRRLQAQPDERVVIFPEGRITLTGTLMKIYDGPGMLADKTNAKILPVRLEGLQYTRFSRMGRLLPTRWFTRVQVTVLPPVALAVPATLKGRERRKFIGKQVADVMSEMMFSTADTSKTLYQAMLEAARHYGWQRDIMKDTTNQILTYRKLVLGSEILGRRMVKNTAPGDVIGLLLPNVNAAVVSFFGVLRFGRVPAMLNFTAGFPNLHAAVEAAEIKKIYTSRKFVEAANLEPLLTKLEMLVEVVYLEDVRARLWFGNKLLGMVRARLPWRAIAKPTDPLVILFTSGSEGPPKGVVLSHQNMLSNYAQVMSRMDFNPGDLLLNALPLFHSFGLAGGVVLPLLTGIRTLLYPSPLHFRMIPEMVYEFRATVMFGTDTFLSRYAMFAHPYDFQTTRIIFAGAEKLKATTRQVWLEKFGVRVLEGYGATEASPVLSVNTVVEHKPGTVGRFVPGIAYRLQPVPGVATGGALHVQGPNIMLGYLKHDAPGVIQPPATAEEGAGWYDTGDIVSVDEEGFVQVVDRVKRFAKVAGEMVPLTNVEAFARTVWPHHHHGVIAVEDARRGERLILFTDNKEAQRADLVHAAREKDFPELFLPREIVYIYRLPVLGTGKIDYPALRALYAAGQGASNKNKTKKTKEDS